MDVQSCRSGDAQYVRRGIFEYCGSFEYRAEESSSPSVEDRSTVANKPIILIIIQLTNYEISSK